MSTPANTAYDAVLIVSFGGPEGSDDVMPFLANITSGRKIPASRLETVAEQYYHVGGVSPHNKYCRKLQATLAEQLTNAGHNLPVYWGNRNWHPLLESTLTDMAAQGHKRVLAIVTSAYSSYSGCRQYLEDIAAAQFAVGPNAPVVHKVRAFYDHPGFVMPFIDAIVEARSRLPLSLRTEAALLATAHSIPQAMAQACDYEQQLRETARLVAAGAGFESWELVWQSRSGPPEIPWLEPDINDRLTSLAATNKTRSVVVAPIGFVSDHMEVIWDLDVIAAKTAERLNISFSRAITPGTEPDERFVAMCLELIEERIEPGATCRSMGDLETRPHVCPPDCCPKRVIHDQNNHPAIHDQK